MYGKDKGSYNACPTYCTQAGKRDRNVEASTMQAVSYNLSRYRLIWNEREV